MIPPGPASWYQRWLMVCAVHLIAWGLRALYCTLRPVYVQQHFERRAWSCGAPILLAFWHGRMLYFLHLYQRQPFTVLVSRSRDGEFVSRVLGCFGVQVTRGSSSRGGAQALFGLARALRRGCHVAMTPDGPRGPRHIVQPGIVTLAQRTGAIIVPVSYSARWKKVLRSWDRFVVPLPFSRVVVVYGEPISVPASASPAVCHSKRQEIETSLRRITAMADDYFVTSTPRRTGRRTYV